VSKEAYLAAHKFFQVKKPILIHFYHSPFVLDSDIFLFRKMALRLGFYGHYSGNYALTTNSSFARFLVERLGMNQDRVYVVPYPIDTKRFAPIMDRECLRVKYNLPVKRPIVAYVGSLELARGVDVLLDAFRCVLAHIPDALLYISCPNREGEEANRARLYDWRKKLKMQDNMIVHGPSLNVEEIYNLADLIILPFLRPYWVDPPLVLLEAMSSGASVVTTPVGAIGEFVKENESVALAKAGDSSILSSAIIELLENPSESRRLSLRARDTVLRNYSYEAVGRTLLKTYCSILRHENYDGMNLAS